MGTTPNAAPSVVIAICTFRRPELAQTLASLRDLEPCGMPVTIAVADNDAAPTAQDLVTRIAADHPLPLTYLHAPSANISIARNALMDHAQLSGIRLLVFVDDDQIANPAWLRGLIQAWSAQSVGAILGPVVAAYPEGVPDWMVRARPHDTLPVTDAGGRIRTGYTGNSLMDLADPAWQGLRFDLARGRSGGEDTALFADYAAAGGRIGFAADAILHETIPADRAKLSWLLRRRYRMGQTHASILARRAGMGGRFGAAGLASAKALACGVMALGRAADPAGRNPQLMRAALHAGAVAQLLGAQQIELYGTTPGLTHNPKGN
nr:glycosyltransferase [Paracoccus saliphilus]